MISQIQREYLNFMNVQIVKEQFLTEINTDLYCGLTIKIEFIQEEQSNFNSEL